MNFLSTPSLVCHQFTVNIGAPTDMPQKNFYSLSFLTGVDQFKSSSDWYGALQINSCDYFVFSSGWPVRRNIP